MDRKEEHAMALQSAQARAAKQEYIAQTSTGGPSREGGKDLPYLPEAMAGGMRPEEL
jgi:hypothetical protein